MGDMAEAYRDHKNYIQREVAAGRRVSNRYETESDRAAASEAKWNWHEREDQRQLKLLDRLGLDPVYKSVHAIQVKINDRRAMFYYGKNGQSLRFNDGEVLKFLPGDSITNYVKRLKNV